MENKQGLELTRRNVALLIAGGPALLMLETGCDQISATKFQAELAAIIDKVQSGVKTVCAGAGTWIPFASVVVNVIVSKLPQGVADAVKATEAIVDQAIKAIAAVCPPAGTPTPTAAPMKTAEGVDIHFY